MTMESDESKPFLAFEEESPKPSVSHNKLKELWPTRTTVLLHLALILFYTAISILVIQAYSRPNTLILQGQYLSPKPRPSLNSIPASPLRDVTINYQTTTFKNLTGNAFAGPPSPEIDAAWDALLSPVNMRVTSEELERMGQSSVPLPEGGGYLAWLQSFHEIHCIVSTMSSLQVGAS